MSDVKVQGVCWLLLRTGYVLLEACPKKAAVLDYPQGTWFVPGGKIEGNETAEQCLVRELSEEWPGTRVVTYAPFPLIEGSAVPPGPRGLFLVRPFIVTVEGRLPLKSADGVVLGWTRIETALASPVPQVRMMVAGASGAALIRTLVKGFPAGGDERW